jgi:hypothetical protein
MEGRVYADILNKQSRTADKRFLGMRLATPRHKNKFVTEYHKWPRAWTDSLVKRSKLKVVIVVIVVIVVTVVWAHAQG